MNADTRRLVRARRAFYTVDWRRGPGWRADRRPATRMPRAGPGRVQGRPAGAGRHRTAASGQKRLRDSRRPPGRLGPLLKRKWVPKLIRSTQHQRHHGITEHRIGTSHNGTSHRHRHRTDTGQKPSSQQATVTAPRPFAQRHSNRSINATHRQHAAMDMAARIPERASKFNCVITLRA